MLLRIDDERLAKSLRATLAELAGQADLPSQIAWPQDVRAKYIASTGTHHDRFTDGTVEVYRDGKTWIFDGGADEKSFQIAWTIEVDTGSGRVRAHPSLCTREPGPDIAPQDLGVEPREIGEIGPLEALFPSIEGVSDEYGLPFVFGLAVNVRRHRVLIASQCLRPDLI